MLTLERQVRYKAKAFVLDGLLRPKRPMGMLRLGTYYGGWWIPEVAPEDGAAVCVGAGLDVSFDVELHRLGYAVFTVDPTPAAVDFVSREAPQLTLIPLGVWTESGQLEFDQDAAYNTSWAISDVQAFQNPNARSKFTVVTVKDLLGSIGQPHPAILKLDIEGAEHAVIRSLLKDGVRPRTLCVEFDDQRLRKIYSTVRLLRDEGYELLQIEGYNYILSLRSSTPDGPL